MKEWWHRQSVRTRLAWSYAITVAVILLAYSVGIFIFVSQVLNQELNDRLREDFEFAEESLEVTEHGVETLRPGFSREHDELQPWIERPRSTKFA